MSDAAELSRILGHEFARPELLRQALTHASAAAEGADGHYERLEFLGDRVLGLIVAETLLERFPEVNEGELAVRLNALVRRETVAETVRHSGLARHIRLGASERSGGGRTKPAILADVGEAVIGALFLDGGLEIARDYVLRHWGERFDTVARARKDAKTRLQEHLQRDGGALPSYEVVRQEGPDHQPVFTVQVRAPDGAEAEGSGGTRRDAEQEAAAALLARLGGDG